MLTPNSALQYTEESLTDTKGETDKSTTTAGDFNTALWATDKTTRQKLRKDTEAPATQAAGKIEWTDTYWHTIPQQQETNAPAHRHSWAIPRTDHVLTHKTNPNKFKRTGFIQSVFSDHTGITQENMRKTRQSLSTWKWNNTCLNSLGSEDQRK